MSLGITGQFQKPSHSRFPGRKKTHIPRSTCPAGGVQLRTGLRQMEFGTIDQRLPLGGFRRNTQVRKAWTVEVSGRKRMISGQGQKGLLVTPALQPRLDPFPAPVTFGGVWSCVPCLWGCGSARYRGPQTGLLAVVVPSRS